MTEPSEHTDKTVCYNNMYDNCDSAYCMTSYCVKFPNDNDPCCDIFMSCVCLPIKIGLFLPCHCGSFINCILNKCKKTNKNYLF